MGNANDGDAQASRFFLRADVEDAAQSAPAVSHGNSARHDFSYARLFGDFAGCVTGE
jgi:hypothetical protein